MLLSIVSLCLLSRAVLSQRTCREISDVRFTFYGVADGNSDVTAFSCGDNGGKAGGDGTYSNPETFATSKSNPTFTRCEIIYIPYLHKYLQYTDLCVQCDADYTSHQSTHIDLWIGSNTSGQEAQILCELSFGSIQGQTIIQNPPSTLPVDHGMLWDGTSCHDASSPSPFVYPDTSYFDFCAGTSSSNSKSPFQDQDSILSTSSVGQQSYNFLVQPPKTSGGPPYSVSSLSQRPQPTLLSVSCSPSVQTIFFTKTQAKDI